MDPPPADGLDALLARALEQKNAGALDQALHTLVSAQQTFADDATFHHAVGSLQHAAGQHKAARQSLARAAELEPEVAEFWGSLGAAQLAAYMKQPSPADLATAVVTLEKAATLGPRLPLVRNNLGHAYLLAGRLDQALQSLEHALAMDPAYVPALFNKAAVLHAQGHETQCLATLDAVLALAPDFEPARASRLNTLKRLGRG